MPKSSKPAANCFRNQRRDLSLPKKSGQLDLNSVPKMVGLMTQLEVVSSPIRLKSSGQTFSGTEFVSQKTCLTTVGCPS